MGISQRFMRPSSQFSSNQHQQSDAEAHGSMAGEVEDDEDSTDPEEWLQAILDVQVGHSPHVVGSIYG